MRYYLAAAALVLAGCGGAGATVTTTVTPESAPAPSPSASLAADAANPADLPACASLFGIGSDVPVTGDQLQCKDALGATYIVGLFRCTDGTHLGSVDPTSGAPRGWFRAPGQFHPITDDAAKDPAYAAAYRTCLG